MNQRSLFIAAFVFSLNGCGDLPPAPDKVPTNPDDLPSWDTVKESTHTKASRPPEPVLIVDRKAKMCFKVYSIFPQEYRLPNGQAYSIRDCSDDCGTPINCPSWAQDVHSDWTMRKERKQTSKNPPQPVTEEPKAPPEDMKAPPKNSKQWPENLGPPPTEEPEEEPTPKPSEAN